LKSFGVDTSVPVAAAGPAAAAGAPKTAEEKSAFDVVLDSVPADKRLLS
jgi:ribosomal protein L7/L12